MNAGAPVIWSINGRFLTQPMTGVQRYASEMTRAIDAHLAADEGLSRRIRCEVLLPANCTVPPRYDALPVRQSRHGRGYTWEQFILPFMARGGLINFANLAPLAQGRQIVCMHDANVYLEPTSYTRHFRFAYRALFPRLARRASAVTTVSGFSAAMLKDFGVTGPLPSHVIPNGHEHALRWNAAASRFSAPDAFRRPFIFALGSRARHKQIDLLIDLAPALDALGIDLVISGGRASIFAATEEATMANVLPIGFVSDDDLAALFHRALCFAFPSRTEGFGLPLLEAMVHGAPIIASDCASMPEVCGPAALYAAPNDPAAWLRQINRLVGDPDLRRELRAKGTKRYPAFSWRKGAQAYLDLALGLSPRGVSAEETVIDAKPLHRTAA